MKNLAKAVLDSWYFLLFTDEEDLHPDTAAKEEEGLIYAIENKWTDEERNALQEAAQERIKDKPPIDPEDTSQDKELRFFTFIATGRIDDLWML